MQNVIENGHDMYRLGPPTAAVTVAVKSKENTYDCQLYNDMTTQRLINENVNRDRGNFRPDEVLIASHFPQQTMPSVRWPSASAADSDLWKIAREMVESERTYVDDLHRVILGYMIPLTTSDIFEERNLNAAELFGNIQAIYHFNSQFVQSLESHFNDPIQMTHCFVEYQEGFEVYTAYCTNYPNSVEMLAECSRDDEIREVLKAQQILLQHKLPLGSYLLKPVQRILKYHLFLQKMLNCCEMDTTAYSTIAQALNVMKTITHNMNEMKRRHERAVRVQEVQSMLVGWDDGHDLMTLGELLLEDNFHISGVKSSRLLLLFEKGLMIAKAREDGLLEMRSLIKCSELMLYESVPQEPLNFHIIPFENPRLQCTIQTRSLLQKHEWCQEIKRLILNSYPNAAIPQKAKELVMKLGNSQQETDAFPVEAVKPLPLTSIMSPKKQHNVPAYLEKRRMRRKISAPSMSVDETLLLATQSSTIDNSSRDNVSSTNIDSVHNTTSAFNEDEEPSNKLHHLVSSPNVFQQEAIVRINHDLGPSTPRLARPSSMIEDRCQSVQRLTDYQYAYSPQPVPKKAFTLLPMRRHQQYNRYDGMNESSEFLPTTRDYNTLISSHRGHSNRHDHNWPNSSRNERSSEHLAVDLSTSDNNTHQMNTGFCASNVDQQLQSASDVSYYREVSTDSVLSDTQYQADAPFSLDNIPANVGLEQRHSSSATDISQRLLHSKRLIFANGKAFRVSKMNNQITNDKSVDRTIQCLGTPVLNYGPRDVLNSIQSGKVTGNKILMYGTPPRLYTSVVSLNNADSGANKTHHFHSHMLMNDLELGLLNQQTTLRSTKSAPMVTGYHVNQSTEPADGCVKSATLRLRRDNIELAPLRRKGMFSSLRNVLGDIAAKISRKKQRETRDSPSPRGNVHVVCDNPKRAAEQAKPTVTPVSDRKSGKQRREDFNQSKDRAKPSFFTRVSETYNSFRLKHKPHHKDDKKAKLHQQSYEVGNANMMNNDLTTFLKTNGCGSTSLGARMASNSNDYRYFATYSLHAQKSTSSGKSQRKNGNTNQAHQPTSGGSLNKLASSEIQLHKSEDQTFKARVTLPNHNMMNAKYHFLLSAPSANNSTESLDTASYLNGSRSAGPTMDSPSWPRERAATVVQPNFRCTVVPAAETGIGRARAQFCHQSPDLEVGRQLTHRNGRNIKRSLSTSINEKIQRFTETTSGAAASVERTASEQSLTCLSERSHELQTCTTLTRIRQNSSAISAGHAGVDKRCGLPPPAPVSSNIKAGKPPTGRPGMRKAVTASKR